MKKNFDHTYIDTISGETLYCKNYSACFQSPDEDKEQEVYHFTQYHKDPACKIQHRIDGPSDISWDKPDFYRYCKDGRLHREDGPAIRAPHVNDLRRFYLEGKLICTTHNDQDNFPKEYRAALKEYRLKAFQ